MAEKKIQVFNKERPDKCCLAFFPSIYIQPVWTNESAGTSFISFLPPVLLPSHTQKRMENPLQEGTRFPESITDSSLLLLTLSHRCTLNWLTVSPTASRDSLLWNVLWSGTFHCLTNLSDPYNSSWSPTMFRTGNGAGFRKPYARWFSSFHLFYPLEVCATGKIQSHSLSLQKGTPKGYFLLPTPKLAQAQAHWTWKQIPLRTSVALVNKYNEVACSSPCFYDCITENQVCLHQGRIH